MMIYPSCLVCGGVAWESGGGSYGALPQVSYARCAACGAHLADIYGGFLSVLILVRGAQFPDDWVNQVVLAVMRRRAREADVWRDGVYAEIYARAFGIRQLPKDWRWDDARRTSVDAAVRDHAYATGQDVITYAGMTLPPPVLARVPPRDVAWVWARAHGESVWTLLDPEATRDLPLPVDPFREQSDAFWVALDAWHAESGFLVSEREEIENRYAPDASRLEPWYQWKYRHIRVTAGPRKRVYALYFAGLGVRAVEAMRALADADGVTFNDDSDDAVGSVAIHAWSEAKMREYLKAAYETVDAG